MKDKYGTTQRKKNGGREIKNPEENHCKRKITFCEK